MLRTVLLVAVALIAFCLLVSASGAARAETILRFPEGVLGIDPQPASNEDLADFERFPLERRVLLLGDNPLDQIVEGEAKPLLDHYFWVNTSEPIVYVWNDGRPMLGCMMWYKQTPAEEGEEYPINEAGEVAIKGPDGEFRFGYDHDRTFDLETCSFDPNRGLENDTTSPVPLKRE